MGFLSEVETGFLDDLDIQALRRETEVDELVIELMNYIKNVDYCDEVLQSPDR
jgi:hypothetical protein